MFGKFGYQVIRATQNNFAELNNSVENVSNVNSIGYKKRKVTFVEALNGQISKHETKEFSQGSLRRTNLEYDFALNGPGFFVVELQNGQRAYTRAGRFALTSEGELVTTEGYRVIPEVEASGRSIIEVNTKEDSELGLNIKVKTPRLIIPATLSPVIEGDGKVYGLNNTTGEKTEIGKISVVNFNNPQGLESLSRSYFLQTNESGLALENKIGPDYATQVKQGYLEFGNVDISAEFFNLSQMRNLISAQFKLFKIMDKIYENVHYTISRSV